MTEFSFFVDSSKPRTIYGLNGVWRLQPGGCDTQPTVFDHRVHVPALVDVAIPSYDWKASDRHWYQTVFTIDRVDSSNRVYVNIEQSMFGTRVWVNDEYVGGSISCYTSQEYRIDQFLLPQAQNTLTVCVGARETLPPESAVGNDQEREVFVPGVWGDVSLIVCGAVRVKRTQVIPLIDAMSIEARITIESDWRSSPTVVLQTHVVERESRKRVSIVDRIDHLSTRSEEMIATMIKLDGVKLWSPEHPFLYELVVDVYGDGRYVDQHRTVFGMREFRVVEGDFILNGKKIFLRGSNIAFHRFLSDPQRRLLPWDLDWAKRVLIDIPKQNYFNVFRIHLGQAYNRWYDLADQYGMLIQNEWQFWRASGTKEQITREFTEWLQDNWNHPSIIVWDALNECNEPVVENEVVPQMKQLDATRPWEPNDIRDHHPYIYSLGSVLNERRLGFTDSVFGIERQETPTVVNEFLWWWITDEGEPTGFMKGVVERWLGANWTKEVFLEHQAWLAQELIELFRRIGADAIQPFIYLGNGKGATAHWFLGDIAALNPKPVLQAVKNAFAPFGVSIELWDRHFFQGETRTINIYVFNDRDGKQSGTLNVRIMNEARSWMTVMNRETEIHGVSRVVLPIEVVFPDRPDSFQLRAELVQHGEVRAYSSKPAIVFPQISAQEEHTSRSVSVLSESGELKDYLLSQDIPMTGWTNGDRNTTFLVDGGVIRSKEFRESQEHLSHAVHNGATLVLIEPECHIEGEASFNILSNLNVRIAKRPDVDKGGYDSYVFAVDDAHPLWDRLPPNSLKLFNGGVGGEIVSQHDVVIDAPHAVLARCGLGLNVVAAAEIPYGSGRVILFRLQLRGRLMGDPSSSGLYARRVDPVAQQLLLNLLLLGPRSSS